MKEDPGETLQSHTCPGGQCQGRTLLQGDRIWRADRVTLVMWGAGLAAHLRAASTGGDP